MRVALLIAVPLGAFLTAVAWRLTELLSPDAIGMAIGMAFGVFAGIPTVALVAMARRRDEEDDWQPTVIDYPAPPAVTYSHEVTGYSRLARRGMGLPALPDRTQQIADLRAVLDAIEAEEARR